MTNSVKHKRGAKEQAAVDAVCEEAESRRADAENDRAPADERANGDGIDAEVFAAGARTPEPIMMLPRKRKVSAARVLTVFAELAEAGGAGMACISFRQSDR